MSQKDLSPRLRIGGNKPPLPQLSPRSHKDAEDSTRGLQLSPRSPPPRVAPPSSPSSTTTVPVSPRGRLGVASPRGVAQLRQRVNRSRESGYEESAEPTPSAAVASSTTAPVAQVPTLVVPGSKAPNRAVAVVRERSRAVDGGAQPPALGSWKPLQQFGKPRRNSLCSSFAGDPVLRMVQLLCEHSFYVEHLAHMVDSTDSQRLADALVNVSVPFGRTLFLIKAMIRSEFEQNRSQPSSILRGNVVTSKLMGAYSFFLGTKFLEGLVGCIVRDVIQEGERLTFEVDPSKEPSADKRTQNRKTLIQWTLRLVESITADEALERMPSEMRSIAKFTADNAREVCPENLNQLVGGYLILRLVNPVLVAPEAYGVVDTAPLPRSRRNLTLMSKLLQNISNGAVSTSKEAFMADFSDFVKEQTGSMAKALNAMAAGGVDTTDEPAIPVEQADVGFLEGRHLAFLHKLLSQNSNALSKALAELPRKTLAEMELINILPLVKRDQVTKPVEGPSSQWMSRHLRSGFIMKMGDKKRKKHKKRFRLEVTRYFVYFFVEDDGGDGMLDPGADGSRAGKLVKTVPMVHLKINLKQVKRDSVLELEYCGRTHCFVNHDTTESVAAWAQSLQAAAGFDFSTPQTGNTRFVNVPSKGAVSDVLTAFHNWPRLAYKVSMGGYQSKPVPGVKVVVAAFDCTWEVSLTLSDALQLVAALDKELKGKCMVPPPPHVLTRGERVQTSKNAERLDYALYVSGSEQPSLGLRLLREWVDAFLWAAQSNPLVSHSTALLAFLELTSPFRAAVKPSLEHMKWIRRYFVGGLGVHNSRGNNVLMQIVGEPSATTPIHAEIIKFLVDSRAVDLMDVDVDGNSALHRAIASKCYVHALTLCEMGIDHLPNKWHQHPLHLAASIGVGNDVEKLIDVCYKSCPSSLLSGDRKGRTPLHLAVARKDEAISMQLLELVLSNRDGEGPIASLTGTPMNSLLHTALRNGLGEVALKLVREHLVDLKAVDIEGQTPLHVAALAGNAEATELLLATSGTPPSERDRHMMTPLLCAALGGNVVALNALLPVSDAFALDDQNRSVLNCAAEAGSFECLTKVLELGGQDVDATDSDGRCPLFCACRASAPEAVQLLLEKGANPNVCDRAGTAPLHAAAQAYSLACCKLLVETGKVDVATSDKLRHDALYYAVDGFDGSGTELISYFLSLGVKPHNLAHLAASKRSLPLLLLLLNGKADPNAIDRVTGNTALHVAVQNADLPMVMALLNAGAWPTVRNTSGASPLSLAIASKKKELVVVFAQFDKEKK